MVIAADGSTGDVHPMIHLGRIAREAGHEVRVCAPPDFEVDAQRASLEFVGVGEPVTPYMQSIATLLLDRGVAFMRETERYLQRSIAAQFERIPDACRDADLVIAGGLQLAAQSGAERSGVPFHYVMYSPVMIESGHHPPLSIATQTLPRALNRLLWWGFRRYHDAKIRPWINTQRTKVGLPPVKSSLVYMIGASPVLAADAPLFRPPPDAPALTIIPALTGLSRDPLPPHVADFIEGGPAPVYIGFGSMPDDAPEKTTQLVIEAASLAGRRAILSSGWARLGHGARAPDNVLLIDVVSHATLFPRLAGVVHHGGAGTTTVAARAGVPQLIVPHLLDQFHHAHVVERFGLGPTAIPRRKLTVAKLAAALRELTENDAYRAAARTLAGQIDTDPRPHVERLVTLRRSD